MQRRKYKFPPIQEALCEVIFQPGSIPWDITFPGRFYEVVKSEYSAAPTEQGVIEAEVGARPGGQNVKLRQGVGKVLFSTPDGSKLIGLGRDALSSHFVGRYPGWEHFRPEIEFALDSYRKLADPGGVRRVGVRYINKVDLPRNSRIDEYIRSAPARVDGLPDQTEAFLIRTESWFADRLAKLLLTIASVQPQSDDAVGVLVDIDIVREFADPGDIGALMGWIDDFKGRLTETFEALVTDNARRLFDGSNQA